jgi:hypothetical protein
MDRTSAPSPTSSRPYLTVRLLPHPQRAVRFHREGVIATRPDRKTAFETRVGTGVIRLNVEPLLSFRFFPDPGNIGSASPERGASGLPATAMIPVRPST